MTTKLERELTEKLQVAEHGLEKLQLAKDGLESLQTRLDAIAAEVADFRKSREDQHMSDDQRELLRDKQEAMSNADLVGFLLSGQKLVEDWAYGRGCFFAEAQTTALTTALNRFAPEAFGDALAVWLEHAEDVDDA